MTDSSDQRITELESTVALLEDQLALVEQRRVRGRRIRLIIFVVLGLLYAAYFQSMSTMSSMIR